MKLEGVKINKISLKHKVSIRWSHSLVVYKETKIED